MNPRSGPGPADEQRLALGTAQTLSGRSAHLLEKDIWVVQTLDALFTAPFAHALVFKGGTSLTKAWNAIRRFSEDVDVTHDIRAIAPDLVGDAEPDALPPTRSQEQRWTKAIRARLATWVTECAAPAIEAGLAIAGTPVSVQCDGYRLTIEYTPLFRERSLVRPDVLVEFGARSTGEPHAARRVVCDVAPFVPDIAFPEAHPTAMLAERTFWEKATAAHVYCRRERAAAAGAISRDTGRTSCGSTAPVSRSARSQTINWRWTWRTTRRSSSARRTRLATGLTTGQPFRGCCSSSRPEPPASNSPRTIG